MATLSYSSIAAFLAHYQALAKDGPRTEEEQSRLEEMNGVIHALGDRDRSALNSGSDAPTARRHRERAELNLGRELIRRGILMG